jgi:hypothetical protein
MKQLILITLILTTSICYSQEVARDYSLKIIKCNPEKDTVRSTLLISRGPMRLAHQYEGYAIISDGRYAVEFLDAKRKPFKPPVRVWGYIILKQTNDD